MTKSVSRLFQSFQPEHYDLTVNLDRGQMRFNGSVTVSGRKVGRPSKRLTFHANQLKITSAAVTVTDKRATRPVTITRINQHKSFQEVRLHSDNMLYPGTYTVTMEFEAAITPGMAGLYPCYFTHDGQEQALLATQFESHHAREVFPCIDEPEAKATFDLTLQTEPAIIALSNTPTKTQSTADDIMTTTFETTPRMSSYLLAWVVGDMQHASATTKSGVEVSVWSTKAQPFDSLDFGLDAAVRSIEFFEDYFGVPYPLAKADHVALPDFSSGAMENWGLITYRERVLLAYPGEAGQSTLEHIAVVVAHETSHQWFGNLVTMKWWNDLWLNESFANMMEYQATDALYPQWQIWDSFIANEALSALRRDATHGVQAVRTEVNHPDEINSLFDPSIVYAKGGRLLYMLKNHIGEDAFRAGLTSYFKKFAYKNTDGSDLWTELSQSAGQDVAAFMNPWLTRNGFPVVSISQENGVVNIGQSHFSDDPAKADPARLWPVPLFSTSHYLPDLLHEATVACNDDSKQLIRLNSGARGHYIVEYKTAWQQQQLKQLVAGNKLSNGERQMLLNDASMLARAGYQQYGQALELMTAYASESNDSVWDIIAMIFAESRRFIDYDESLEAPIKTALRHMIETQYLRLGWQETDGETAADQKLRAGILGLGAYAGHSKIIAEALQRFEAYQTDQASVSPEIRAVVFVAAVRSGSAEAFDYLLALHDSSSNSDLKSDIAAAVTATHSNDRATELLKRIKDNRLVKPQDADRWLVYLMRNRHTRDVAWQWMVDEWPWIETTYKNDMSYDYMPRYAAGGCNTPEWAAKFRDFYVPKQDQPVLKRNIMIGLEEIDNRVSWMQRDLTSVQDFFKRFKSEA